MRGVKESAGANNTMVVIKIAAILLFCLRRGQRDQHGQLASVRAATDSPGVLTGASIVFFTYIGFDSVSTAAEECSKPQRDLPIGIIATLIVCTILYASVSLVLTGIMRITTSSSTDSPVADALKALGYNRLRLIVTAGALMGMLSSLLVYQYGQARIWFAMSRDRLLPGMFSRGASSASRRRTSAPGSPALFVGIPAGIWDIDTLRRAVEHRHAVRVCAGLGGRDRAAAEAAGTAASVPRAAGAAGADALDRLLPGADDGPAAGDLDPVLRLADHRAGDLLPLQQAAQRTGVAE